MRLYYMTPLKTAFERILPEWRMKLSTFDTVNDPFELLGATQGDPVQKRVLKILRDHWTGRLGMICLAPTWKSPLMWAHYADGHKGVCLGIDVVEEDKIKKVFYASDRLEGLFDAAKPNAGATHATLLQVLTTKYKQWEYEEEHRVFAALDDRDPLTGHHYVDFDDKVVLREVIVGARCKKPVGEFAKVIRATGNALRPITIIKARAAFETFTMTRQKRVTPITVRPTGLKR